MLLLDVEQRNSSKPSNNADLNLAAQISIALNDGCHNLATETELDPTQ